MFSSQQLHPISKSSLSSSEEHKLSTTERTKHTKTMTAHTSITAKLGQKEQSKSVLQTRIAEQTLNAIKTPSARIVAEKTGIS